MAHWPKRARPVAAEELLYRIDWWLNVTIESIAIMSCRYQQFSNHFLNGQNFITSQIIAQKEKGLLGRS